MWSVVGMIGLYDVFDLIDVWVCVMDVVSGGDEWMVFVCGLMCV